MNIENDDGLISVENNIDYKSLEKNDFKSVTNHNNKCDKIINGQVKEDNSIKIEPSMASKEVKGDNSRNIEPSMTSTETRGDNPIHTGPGMASKESKGDNSIDIKPNMAPKEPVLHRNIRKNFARINELLEAFPLCDHLFQHDVISMAEHSEIRLKWKSNHSDANDDLMKKLCKREFDPEILRKALNETKQSWVVKLLFPVQ